MPRSRSRSPPARGSSSHSKHNWNASSPKHPVPSGSRNDGFSSLSRVNSGTRNSTNSEINSNNSTDNEDGKPEAYRSSRDVKARGSKRHKSRQKSLDEDVSEGTSSHSRSYDLEELRKIRVIIERKTLHQPDNSPLNRTVKPEEVFVPRRSGEGSRPIFDREEIKTGVKEIAVAIPETRRVTTLPENRYHSKEKPSDSKRDHYSKEKRSADIRKSRESDHARSSHKEAANSVNYDGHQRSYESDIPYYTEPSTSRSYRDEPSTSKSCHDRQASKLHSSSSKEHESRKKYLTKREDSDFDDDRRVKEKDYLSLSKKRHGHHNDKLEKRRRSSSPAVKTPGTKSLVKSSDFNNGGEHSRTSSQESDPEHNQSRDEGERPPWFETGYHRIMEPFPPGPHIRWRLPPTILQPIPRGLPRLPPPRLPPGVPPGRIIPGHPPLPPPRHDGFIYPGSMPPRPRPPPFPGAIMPRRPYW